MMDTFLTFIIFTFLSDINSTIFGFDISQPVTTSAFQCLKKNNFTFVIIRAYQSFGSIDKNAAQTLQNAKSTGLNTSIYMFPCSSKNPQTQVDDLIKTINPHLYSQIWLDVQTNPSPGCNWSSTNHTTNCNFLLSLITRISYHKKSIGIYCSSYMWKTIFGSNTSCKQASLHHMLWYPHFNNIANFNDFKTFGGWNKSNIKQFAANVKICGINLDKNLGL